MGYLASLRPFWLRDGETGERGEGEGRREEDKEINIGKVVCSEEEAELVAQCQLDLADK